MQKNFSGSTLGFLIPSIAGVLLFMIPVNYGGEWTIMIKFISDIISNAIIDYIPLLCLIITTLSAILGIAFLSKPNLITNYPMVQTTFSTTAIWVVIRILGAIFIWLTFFEVGVGEEGIISMITSEDNGGFILHDLLVTLFVIFFLAGLLLPLLLDF